MEVAPAGTLTERRSEVQNNSQRPVDLLDGSGIKLAELLNETSPVHGTQLIGKRYAIVRQPAFWRSDEHLIVLDARFLARAPTRLSRSLPRSAILESNCSSQPDRRRC